MTGDVDAFIDGGAKGVRRATSGMNTVFAQDDTLTATVAVAPGTAAAGTITLIAYIGGTA